MSPKIDIYGPQGLVPGRSRSVEAPAPSGVDKPAAAVAPGDSLKLTDDALRLSAVAKAAAASPDLDLERVADIRERLQDGRYQIRAEVIATRLARLEWELAGA